MKVVKKYSHNGQNYTQAELNGYLKKLRETNARICPSCLHFSLSGMPGGRDAQCINCGYKDPCCYD